MVDCHGVSIRLALNAFQFHCKVFHAVPLSRLLTQELRPGLGRVPVIGTLLRQGYELVGTLRQVQVHPVSVFGKGITSLGLRGDIAPLGVENIYGDLPDMVAEQVGPLQVVVILEIQEHPVLAPVPVIEYQTGA